MLKYYIKHAIRNFKANRLIFTGSIITISLGVLCISLLFTYIHNELTMDDFHHRKKDIYLLTQQASPESQREVTDARAYFGFNYKVCPGIENIVTIKKYKAGEIKFTFGESSFSPEGIVADSTFFEVFDFTLKTGDRKTVLHDPGDVVLTEEFSQKLFGNEDPIGKTIKVTEKRIKIYTVSGIVESPPSNSSMTFNFILPDHSSRYSRMGGDFILVNNNLNRDEFFREIKDLAQKNFQFKDNRIDLFPLDDVYFKGKNLRTLSIFSKFGDKKTIFILFAIIGIIFLITMLNFSNLQIININSNIKNIGINKISGSGRKHILYQKITEIFILIIFSAILVTVAFNIILPYYNRLVGIPLAPKIGEIFFLNFLILSLLILVAIIYPSIIYLKVPVTRSLKNQLFSENKIIGKKVVLTIQFALSFLLLVGSIVVVKQLHLMLDKDLGFTSENIICIRLFRKPPFFEGTREEKMEMYNKMQKNFQFLNNELASQSSIAGFARGISPIEPFTMSWKIKGSNKDFTTEKALVVTPDYLKVLGLKLVEGRFFEKGRDKERGKEIVINEAAKKYWGINDISNTKILNKSWDTKNGYEIIGVIKDFNFEHLSVKPQPLIMLYFEDVDDNFLLKFEKGFTQSGLKFVKQLFEKLNAGETFTYSFLLDDIEVLYQKEKRLSEIYILFTIIAYGISAIGLFSISLYDTRRRTKEIGIRKVNGAKVSEILAMLNKDFVKWVVIAFVVACPVAYYAMHKWLENFAYKTTLSWWIFALAGVLALGIALLTVSWQSWKAATRNPVEALRYE